MFGVKIVIDIYLIKQDISKVKFIYKTVKNRQQNNIQNTFGNVVEIIMNENTYIKLKVNPSENLEHNINKVLNKNYFPRYKYQLSYLANFLKNSYIR